MSELMDEKTYRGLAFAALKQVMDLFDDVDADDADPESSGDVLRIAYSNGSHCVVNTQTPTRQLWLAGTGRGWHFSYDAAAERWLDEKGSGDELFDVLRRVTRESCGVDLPNSA